MRSFIQSLFLGILLILPMIGCEDLDNSNSNGSSELTVPEPQPAADLAIAFLWDCTATAAENRAAADQFLRRVLKSQSVPNGTHIAIIRIDANPKILFDGVKTNPDKVLRTWQEASTSKLVGTDHERAFDAALAWFNAQEQANAKRKVVVAWTDLVPDNWKDGSKVIRTVRDPHLYLWGNARALGLKVIIAGVPYEAQPGFRKAWEPHFVIQPRFFGPRHDLQITDLGLQVDDSIF